MKKTYTKPNFSVEAFTLSQNISACLCFQTGAGAGGSATHADATSCAWRTNAGILFTDAAKGCVDIIAPELAELAYDFCYNNPSGDTAAFAS